RIKSGVVVLASPSEGKVSIVVGVTPDLTKKVPAGQVVKQLAPIVGGAAAAVPTLRRPAARIPRKSAKCSRRREVSSRNCSVKVPPRPSR
ncbi:MAG TPA: hypothetical protein VN654_22100, partial [Vicinamibacterales bacterium]|nr:hypothetical protein [Vicinamibacterales bacterium]